MKRHEIRKLQLVQLKILKRTHEICEMLGINYYLIGGTLLGAVRHGGFIPWDVDIDIAMPRRDYEIFRKYCTENTDDSFCYKDYTTEKIYSTFHATFTLKDTEIVYAVANNKKRKVKHDGIYIDIFPLDFAPEDMKKQKKQARKIKFLSVLIQAKISRDYGAGKLRYFAKKALSVFLKPVSFSFLQKQAEKIMTKYNGCCNSHLVSMASHYSYKKQFMPAEIYGTPQKIKFEDLEFYAPEQTAKYLEQIYGDYMKLPPEETRYKLVDLIEYVNYGKYEESVKVND